VNRLPMASFTKVDFDKALESVSPKVRQAYELSHEALRTMGIPHVVVGGLWMKLNAGRKEKE
jgi:hypothetical protein